MAPFSQNKQNEPAIAVNPNPVNLTRVIAAGANDNIDEEACNAGDDTDSKGNVYVFWDGTDSQTKQLSPFMAGSTNGGRSFPGPQHLVTHVTPTGLPDPNTGDLTFDGLAGARVGLAPAVAIANRAPTGAGASDEIVLAWTEGPTPTDTSPGPNERELVLWSTNGGAGWNGPVTASPARDRPDFVAIGISPDGRHVDTVYTRRSRRARRCRARRRSCSALRRSGTRTSSQAPSRARERHAIGRGAPLGRPSFPSNEGRTGTEGSRYTTRPTSPSPSYGTAAPSAVSSLTWGTTWFPHVPPPSGRLPWSLRFRSRQL